MIITKPCSFCNKQAIRNGLCEDHITKVRVLAKKPKKRKNNKKRKKRKNNYPLKNCPKWRDLRTAYLAQNRYCERCLINTGRLKVFATDVDHIKPVREYPELAYEISNLQSLCRSCHAYKTTKYENKGEYPDYRKREIYYKK